MSPLARLSHPFGGTKAQARSNVALAVRMGHAPLRAERQHCRWALGEIETACCRSVLSKKAKLTSLQEPEPNRTNHRLSCAHRKLGLTRRLGTLHVLQEAKNF